MEVCSHGSLGNRNLVSGGAGGHAGPVQRHRGGGRGNTFSTGTVDITTAPTSAIITYTTMAPGDTVVGSLLVDNTSTLKLRYSVSSSATTSTPELKDQLVLTIKTGVTTCSTGGFDTDGTQLYTGDMDSTAGKLVGDVTGGWQTGDRTLAAGVDETLCFKGALPIGTGNAYQIAPNNTATLTFTFDAEQTANNPPL
ncbi:MAG: TasA family protein [Chloroflexota bacterium]